MECESSMFRGLRPLLFIWRCMCKPASLKGLGPERQPEMGRGLCTEMRLGRNNHTGTFPRSHFFLLLFSFISPPQRSKGKAVYLQMAV